MAGASIWEGSRAPRAFEVPKPMAMLYSREGVNAALIGVEVWSAGVIVRLAGVPNEETEALDGNYQEKLTAWARQGERPRSPATQAKTYSMSTSL